MEPPLPVLMGADWNEAVGTGCVTVEVSEEHLNANLFPVAVGKKVFVVETEEMLGSTGTVIEIITKTHRGDTTYAVVDLSEN